MQSRTTELLSHLEKCRGELRAAFDDVPAELRDKQPAADRWSIAQIVEHLVHTESGIAAMLTRALRKMERDGLRPATDDSPLPANTDHARLLDRERKVSAPPTVVPKNNLTSAQAWLAIAESRAALELALRSGDGIDVSSFKAPHPVLGDIDFHRWVAFVASHEARHAAQIRATSALLRS